MKNLKQPKGITLIALIITIIVLLILAGVTISMLTGDNGILSNAKLAADKTRAASIEEKLQLWATEVAMAKITGGNAKSLEELLEEMEDEGLLTAEEVEQIKTSENNELKIGDITISFKKEGNEGILDENWDVAKKVNEPVLLTGMTPIKFTDPTESQKGSIVTTTSTDTEWYNYGAKKWANAKTQDGSMWVWIPRYAYKLNNTTKTADIVFLIGTTDTYVDGNGKIQTAKRASTANDIIDTTTGYTVHPAFTDESSSSLNYANGGWDEELTGIWVAKFEAGYASGNNSLTPVDSSVSYTQASAWLQAAESSTGKDATGTARNYLDGVYGVLNGSTYEFVGGTAPKIAYPTFQGSTFSMNYINHNDAYNIASKLTENGNIYGLNAGNADSHLMKNSEWGAVAYLSQSKYGLNGTNIYINNVNLHSSEGATSVYAVTGCSGTGENAGANSTATVADVNGTTGNTPSNNVYTWNQKNGQRASSTGTIYGIYDLSGGTWERTTGYIARGHANLQKYGESVAYKEGALKTTSTKYTTVYPYNSTYDSSTIQDTEANLNTASTENYKLNTKIYGDAIRETSTAGTGSTSWYGDYSYFPGLHAPFSIRGGSLWNTGSAGLFSFSRSSGDSNCSAGFRAVLVAQ